jgi:hypothetical protein
LAKVTTSLDPQLARLDNGNAAPAKGASKIVLKGNLVMTCGVGEKTSEEKEVELKAHTEAKIGDITLKVTEEKGLGGSGAHFTVTPAGHVLKAVNFKDADGKPVDVTLCGTSMSGKTGTQTFALK